ncbi:hypothetical protein DMI69_04035 [Escherichia coli]|nr:hypothetical protein [Escherichia coli]
MPRQRNWVLTAHWHSAKSISNFINYLTAGCGLPCSGRICYADEIVNSALENCVKARDKISPRQQR